MFTIEIHNTISDFPNVNATGLISRGSFARCSLSTLPQGTNIIPGRFVGAIKNPRTIYAKKNRATLLVVTEMERRIFWSTSWLYWVCALCALLWSWRQLKGSNSGHTMSIKPTSSPLWSDRSTFSQISIIANYPNWRSYSVYTMVFAYRVISTALEI